MTVTISSWDNSQGLRFPKDIMKELHFGMYPNTTHLPAHHYPS